MLAGLIAVAEDGTPTNPALPSANVAQSVRLTGQRLTRGTAVLVPTRDSEGRLGTASVLPTAVPPTLAGDRVAGPGRKRSAAAGQRDRQRGVADRAGARGLSGRPGVDGDFYLLGSGFMEGVSTITVGGVTIVDPYTNTVHGDVTGGRNNSYRLLRRFSLEGPLRITTPGGFHELAGPSFSLPPFVELTGIESVAGLGLPAAGGTPSANPGQTITLVGRGFTTNTLVEFTARDASGEVGRLTRGGTPNADGTRLSVVVPALAATGEVRVIGDAPRPTLQVVPLLRGLGERRGGPDGRRRGCRVGGRSDDTAGRRPGGDVAGSDRDADRTGPGSTDAGLHRAGRHRRRSGDGDHGWRHGQLATGRDAHREAERQVRPATWGIRWPAPWS